MRYVALMRGFGPGDPNMRGEKLRGFFSGLGFTNAHPIISSGNVIFDSDVKDPKKLEDKIEKALPSLLGFSRAVIIRSQPQLEALVAKDPYKGVEHSRESNQLVTFFKAKPKSLDSRPDFYGVDGVNALCSTVDATATKTPDFMTKLDKEYGKDQITSRTYKTVQRILAKLEQTKVT
jgi:uncharacterized protein (DUF1697 family)